MSRVVLSVIAGSRLHGLSKPESDWDVRHVIVPKKRDLLSGRNSGEWEKPATYPSIVELPGEIDVASMFSTQWMWQAIAKGNPNAIELAAAPDTFMHIWDKDGAAIRKVILERCLTTAIATPALGMAKHHLCTVKARVEHHKASFTPKYAKQLREAYRILRTVSGALRSQIWDVALTPIDTHLCKVIETSTTPDIGQALVHTAIEDVQDAVKVSPLPPAHCEHAVCQWIADVHEESYKEG